MFPICVVDDVKHGINFERWAAFIGLSLLRNGSLFLHWQKRVIITKESRKFLWWQKHAGSMYKNTIHVLLNQCVKRHLNNVVLFAFYIYLYCSFWRIAHVIFTLSVGLASFGVSLSLSMQVQITTSVFVLKETFIANHLQLLFQLHIICHFCIFWGVGGKAEYKMKFIAWFLVTAQGLQSLIP